MIETTLAVDSDLTTYVCQPFMSKDKASYFAYAVQKSISSGESVVRMCREIPYVFYTGRYGMALNHYPFRPNECMGRVVHVAHYKGEVHITAKLHPGVVNATLKPVGLNVIRGWTLQRATWKKDRSDMLYPFGYDQWEVVPHLEGTLESMRPATRAFFRPRTAP